MPVQGLVRLRKHQFGRQADFGTKVAATRVYPFKGVPDVDLSWTDPDIDAGSLDPTVAPSRQAPVLGASLTDQQLAYNTLPLLLSGFFGGGEEPTGGGTAKTWAYAPASTTVDEPDVFTYEFGDDVLTDWYQMGDGILASFDVTGPMGLGPLSTSMTWKFGSVASSGSTDSPDVPSVPTALTLDPNQVLVYLKDGGIAIADTVAGLGAGAILDAWHTFTLRFSGDIDEKRYANASQNFDANAYARASRSIELECTFAKTADIVGIGSESDHWMADIAVDRFVRLTFTSTEFAQGSTPYSWVVTMPMRYYTRTEGDSGGNTTVVLTGHAWYDPDDLAGVFTSTVVCQLDSADLGTSGS